MTDDDLLGQIRDHVRRDGVLDAALEAVARGETDSAAVVDLERRAESDRETAALLAASRPLGAAVEARVVAAVGKTSNVASTNAAPSKTNVVPFVRRIAIAAGPLALAAAVLVWVMA